MMRIVNIAPLEPKKNFDLSSLNDLTILIKTLEREDHLIQLLNSIRKYNFNGPVIIADDSKVPYKNNILTLFPTLNIDYIELPYDTGTAEGRNVMLAKVTSKYFLLCDDDFVFDNRTRIPIMKELLVKYGFDILGGVFRQHNRKTRTGRFFLSLNNTIKKFGFVFPSYEFYEYSADFHISKRNISVSAIEYKEPITKSDLIHNFFIARTDLVKSFGGWNPHLKGGEHQNFFIRAKIAGLKVGTTRKCGVIHDQWTKNSDLYKNLRKRGGEFQMIALEEFGVERIEYFKEVLGEQFGLS
jgi:glycosyltransferase involved in cell wall biosynthesis